MTGAYTDPIKDNLSVAVIDTETTELTKVRLEINLQMLAKDVKDNDSLENGSGPTIADFLLHQTTVLYCRQAAQSVGRTNAKYTTDENRLIVRVAPINDVV